MRSMVETEEGAVMATYVPLHVLAETFGYGTRKH